MSRKGFTAGVVLCCLLIASSLVCFYAWVKHNQQDGANPVKYDVAKDEVFFVSTEPQISRMENPISIRVICGQSPLTFRASSFPFRE